MNRASILTMLDQAFWSSFCIFLNLVIFSINLQFGEQYILSIFYLIPISICAWYTDYKMIIFIILMSTLATFYDSEWISGDIVTETLAAIWRTFLHLILFSAIGFLTLKLKRQHQLLDRLSHTDFLTGLFNSRAFYQAAHHEIEQFALQHHSFSIVYIDLDNFKWVNDHLGHERGDQLLQEIAQIMQACIRDSDILARLGGDEFALLLPNTNTGTAQEVLERIRYRFTLQMSAYQYPVTFSVGIVVCLYPPESITAVLEQADQLMCQVKNDKKNAVACQVFSGTARLAS